MECQVKRVARKCKEKTNEEKALGIRSTEFKIG